MYFTDSPQKIKDALFELQIDEVFRNTFGYDEVLGKLDAQSYDKTKMLQEWMSLKAGEILVNDKKVKAVSLNALCTLFAIRSPIVVGKEEDSGATAADIAIFLYVTQVGASFDDFPKLAKKAWDWWVSLKWSIEDAVPVINRLVYLAFEPLEFFPPSPEQIAGNTELHFDSDWCTSMISIVHQMTGLLPNQILDLPVATCEWYYIQYARQQGMQKIGRKSEAEIQLQKFDRTDELIVQRFIEKGVINEADKDYYLTLFKEPRRRPVDFKVREEEKNRK